MLEPICVDCGKIIRSNDDAKGSLKCPRCKKCYNKWIDTHCFGCKKKFWIFTNRSVYMGKFYHEKCLNLYKTEGS